MKKVFRFADVNVGIIAVHSAVYSLCAGYAVDEPEDFMIEMCRQDIDDERSFAEVQIHKHPDHTHPDHACSGYSDDYLETLAVLRKMAEKMPEYDTFLFHASVIAVDGKAYVFAAPSGQGKSTHARLWREMLGERAVMVNDDKPLLKVHEDGSVMAYGTPWDGKHHLSRRITVPVKAVCVLEQSLENQIRQVSKAEALPVLLQQTYRPADPGTMEKTLTLLDRMNIRFYRLNCNMEPGAARLSYHTMKEG